MLPRGDKILPLSIILLSSQNCKIINKYLCDTSQPQQLHPNTATLFIFLLNAFAVAILKILPSTAF
jgi:hypothetical protein